MRVPYRDRSARRWDRDERGWIQIAGRCDASPGELLSLLVVRFVAEVLAVTDVIDTGCIENIAS